MLTRFWHRAHGQEGFTLIELLVVILINRHSGRGRHPGVPQPEEQGH